MQTLQEGILGAELGRQSSELRAAYGALERRNDRLQSLLSEALCSIDRDLP